MMTQALKNSSELELDMPQTAIVEQKDEAKNIISVGSLTPFELLDRAIQSGTAPEVISKLMDMQERWQTTQAKMAYDASMSKAMAEIPVIGKNRKVDFTSPKGRTNYTYEDLSEIASIVKPILQRHGLSFRFRTKNDGNSVTVTCIIAHQDGYSEENSLTAASDQSGNKNSIQAIGSTVTYLERYTLKAALGLSVSDDDDGKGAAARQLISTEQRDQLINLMNEHGINIEAYCDYFNVKSVADIPANCFAKAKEAIGRSIKKRAVHNG